MTVESDVCRNDYVGNGNANAYPYEFYIQANTQLSVLIANDQGILFNPLVLTTDFTVSGVGQDAGGNVTLVNDSQDWLDGDGNLLSGYTITIIRSVELLQETSIRNEGTFYPETHEDVFDYLVFIAQQLNEVLERTLKLPTSVSPDDFDPTLPGDIIVNGANKVPLINEAGDAFLAASDWPTADEIINAQGFSEDASQAKLDAEAAQAAAEAAQVDAEAAQVAAEAALVAAQLLTQNDRVQSVAIDPGVNSVVVAFSSARANANYAPIVSWSHASANASIINPFVDESSITASGFTVNLGGYTEDSGYKLKYFARSFQ